MRHDLLVEHEINYSKMDQDRWLNKNDESCPAPIYADTLMEALEYYGSIYNSLGDDSLPPTIGLPQNIMNSPACIILSSASESAGKRTKEQLLAMRNCLDIDFNGANWFDEFSANLDVLTDKKL